MGEELMKYQQQHGEKEVYMWEKLEVPNGVVNGFPFGFQNA